MVTGEERGEIWVPTPEELAEMAPVDSGARRWGKGSVTRRAAGRRLRVSSAALGEEAASEEPRTRE